MSKLIERRMIARRYCPDLLKALEEIALFMDCDGPGCDFCKYGAEHNPSKEAKIAHKVLKNY